MPEAKDDATESAPKQATKSRRLYAFLGGGFVVLVLLAAVVVLPGRLGPSVVLGGKAFRVDVAASAQQQEQGLSGRTGLAEGRGMLFVFHDSQDACFWMKDMRFSIDMLWFDEQQHLIHQERSVSPDTYPKTFCPPKVARYVLEVPAGTAEKLDLQDNTTLEVNL